MSKVVGLELAGKASSSSSSDFAGGGAWRIGGGAIVDVGNLDVRCRSHCDCGRPSSLSGWFPNINRRGFCSGEKGLSWLADDPSD